MPFGLNFYTAEPAGMLINFATDTKYHESFGPVKVRGSQTEPSDAIRLGSRVPQVASARSAHKLLGTFGLDDWLSQDAPRPFTNKTANALKMTPINSFRAYGVRLNGCLKAIFNRKRIARSTK